MLYLVNLFLTIICLSPADGSGKLPKCYVFLLGNVLVNVSDKS